MDEVRPALVVGPASTMDDDLRVLRPWRRLYRPAVFCVNDAWWLYRGPIDHLVTLHWEKAHEWRAKMVWGGSPRSWCRETEYTRRAGWKPDTICEPWIAPQPIDKSGTSALYAVQIATLLGHSPVVLAGIPMTPTGYTEGAGSHGGDWPQAEVDLHRPAWEYWKAEGKLDHVRSVSGWTRELLGAPTAEFLFTVHA